MHVANYPTENLMDLPLRDLLDMNKQLERIRDNLNNTLDGSDATFNNNASSQYH